MRIKIQFLKQTLCAFTLINLAITLTGNCQFKIEPIGISIKSSFRGLSVVNNSVAWVSGSQGTVGRTLDGGNTWSFQPVADFEKLDFRSIYAFDENTAVIVNAGSPAYVLRTNNGGKTWDQVYKNDHASAFIDGIDFWNENEGILYGDPIDGKLFLLITHDGGKSWSELPADSRPDLFQGEASFAASGTGIRCWNKKSVTIATGGKASRLFTSHDQGKTWNIQTPDIIQGAETTGIFSFDLFKNQLVLVGGDFNDGSNATKNALYSHDMKTWNTPVTPPRGYRECVQFITKNTLIATGPTGTDISFDGGKEWNSLSDETGFHIVRKARRGDLVLLAGSDKISRLVK